MSTLTSVESPTTFARILLGSGMSVTPPMRADVHEGEGPLPSANSAPSGGSERRPCRCRERGGRHLSSASAECYLDFLARNVELAVRLDERVHVAALSHLD